MPSPREAQLYRSIFELRYGKPGIDAIPTASRAYQRRAHRLFEATASCLATLDADRASIRMRIENPAHANWDEALLAAFLRNERTRPPPNLLVAPVQRRGRLWAVLALACDRRSFDKGDGKALAKLTRALSDRLAAIDDARARQVQERIERKILERLRPQDVFYQILHGLRSLTRYDHSSALLIRTPQDELEIAAEQAAWIKTKSRLVGHRIALPGPAGSVFGGQRVAGFDEQVDGVWVPWDDGQDPAIAQTLAFHHDDGAPPERSMLCAPLRIRGRLVGVLKVAARTQDRLGAHEAELLRRFQLHAAVAVDNLQETETLRRDVLKAERKHAMVTVARGISHDVNNALGAILPIVQQMRAELEDGELSRERTLRDLRHLEQAMQTCRRVFAGLVSFAKSRERPSGLADLGRATDNALSILQGSLNRQGVSLSLDVEDDLPPVPGLQYEVEQLVLNLASNACDAMPDGGELTISAAAEPDAVVLQVVDDGPGMTAEQVRRCGEAFYTTKDQGNGLGLSICHSIVQDVRGRIIIDSEVDRGTTVTVTLPVAAARAPEEVAP